QAHVHAARGRDKSVEAEVGELRTPHTAPATTAPTLTINNSSPPATTCIISPANGNRMPNAPHDVPVAKAITAATTKSTGINQTTGIDKESTTEARYSPVPSTLIRSASTQADSKINIAGSIDCAPRTAPRRLVRGVNSGLPFV